MAAVNYAHAYQQALEQAWPYALYFGDLFNTPNNQKYRWVNARTTCRFNKRYNCHCI